MSADMVKREAPRLDKEQIRFIASSSFVPAHYRGKLPEIMACIATGRELGLGDMEALRLIYVVDGRPTLSAECMVKLARRDGHSITATYKEDAVTVVGKRADNGDEMTIMWTAKMAERAGLLERANWKRYPEAMLWARAVSQLCRMLFPDALVGASYTREELEEAQEIARLDEVADVPVVAVETFAVAEGSAAECGDAPDSEDEARTPPSSAAEQESFFVERAQEALKRGRRQV